MYKFKSVGNRTELGRTQFGALLMREEVSYNGIEMIPLILLGEMYVKFYGTTVQEKIEWANFFFEFGWETILVGK